MDKLAHDEPQRRAAVMLNMDELNGILFWLKRNEEKLNKAEKKLFNKLKAALKFLEAME